MWYDDMKYNIKQTLDFFINNNTDDGGNDFGTVER